MSTALNTTIEPPFRTIDGLAIRCVASATRLIHV